MRVNDVTATPYPMNQMWLPMLLEATVWSFHYVLTGSLWSRADLAEG